MTLEDNLRAIQENLLDLTNRVASFKVSNKERDASIELYKCQREISLCHTKLQEAGHWIEEAREIVWESTLGDRSWNVKEDEDGNTIEVKETTPTKQINECPHCFGKGKRPETDTERSLRLALRTLEMEREDPTLKCPTCKARAEEIESNRNN